MTTPVVTREPYDPPVAVEAGRPVERWIVTSEDDERVRQLLIGVVVALVAIVVTLIVLVIAVVHLTRQVEREGTAIRTALAPVGLATAAPTALVPAVPVATTPANVVPVAPVTTATPTIPGVTTPTAPVTPTPTPTPSTPSTSTPAATPPASSTPAQTPSPTPTPSPAPSGGGSGNTAQNPGDAAGGTKSDDPNAAPKGDAQVKVTDQGFDPDLVNIKVGQSVTWTFVGPGNHAVFNEGFKSGPPQATGAFNHVFDKKGTYSVSDPGNPNAFASVVVK